MSATRTYELVYIVTPEATDEQVAELHTQIETIAGRFSGRIEKTENWGRKRLAYEIGRHKEGIYVLELMHGPAEMVKELDRRLKVIDSVVRHLVVRVDEELEVLERRQAERQAERARRREARGLPPEPDPAAATADAATPASAATTGDQGDTQQAEA
jgi:small subunit ribosomal protein S6